MSTQPTQPTSTAGNTAVNLAPVDLNDAALKLDQLFADLDAHQMYTATFNQTSSDTRDQLGYLEDAYNGFKTDLGKLFDGTRQLLRSASSAYAAADAEAAKQFGSTSVVNGGEPQ